MMLGIAFLVAAFAAAVRAVLVRHAGWNGALSSLAAAAICPLLFLAYTFTIDDAVTGGLAMMIGMPIAILAGLSGVGLAIVGEGLFKVGGPIDGGDDQS
jgi:hypothetical protein